jgi:hypothetical protein
MTQLRALVCLTLFSLCTAACARNLKPATTSREELRAQLSEIDGCIEESMRPMRQCAAIQIGCFNYPHNVREQDRAQAIKKAFEAKYSSEITACPGSCAAGHVECKGRKYVIIRTVENNDGLCY